MKGSHSIYNKEFWFNKTPEYFNFKFQLLTYAIDAIFLLYSIISIPLYIFYHIFGDLGLFLDKEKIESNPSLKEEFLENFNLNDISLFWNLFNIIIPIGLIFLNQHLIKVQNYYFLFMYMVLQKIFVFAYLMNCNLTFIPHKSSFIYTIFNIMILLADTLYFIYFIYFYFKSNKNTNNINNDKETRYGKYTINLNEQPASLDTMVHEIQLRMDMAKIKFNSIMIKLKIHKIFKRLLYQPKDFYFMNNSLEQEKQNEDIIRNIKGFKKINNNFKCSDNKSVNSDNNSTTTFASSIDNNYSRLEDEESEPLKI